MAKLPVAIGLSLCEQVVIEDKTHNVTLVNCFTERTVEQFPTDPIPFVAFALLTDGHGEVTLDVAVERLDTMEDVYRKSVRRRFSDPLRAVSCIFRVRLCSFPGPGPYQVTLLAGGEFLAQRRIDNPAQGE